MDFSKKLYSVTSLALILSLFLTTLIIIILLLVCSWEPFANNPFFLLNKTHPPSNNVTANNNSSFVMKDELEMALEKASMGKMKKTVIITIVNKAYVDSGGEYPAMFDLFLEGFWAGEGTRPLLGQLLVVSMDQAAHERCVFRRLNCYSLAAGGGGDEFAGEKLFMSDGFIEMMWRRTAFLLDVLNRGFSFIFTDTDVLWLRDPFTKLSSNETMDFQISTDAFNGNPTSVHNPINTGFYFVRSSAKTVSLFQKWYDARKNATGLKEQDVLVMLVRGGVLGKLGINAEFLDNIYFSGFCKDSRDVKQVATVHANCCRSIVAKVADLKMVLKDWNLFKIGSLSGASDNSQNGTNVFQWSKHTACFDSWHK